MARSPLRTALLACCAALPLAAGACAPRLHVEPVVDMNGERVTATRESTDPYRRGKSHLRAGRPGLALKEFRTALRDTDDPVMVLNGIAVAYDQLGRFDLAERYYHRALARNPNSPETLNNLGYSAYRQGKVTLARQYIERARRVSPGDPVVLANLDLVDGTGGPDRTQRLADRDDRGSPAAVPSAWIERTNAAVQTIVTRPDPELLALSAEQGVHPALVSVTLSPAVAQGRAGQPSIPGPRRAEERAAADGGAVAPVRATPVARSTSAGSLAPAALHLFDTAEAAEALRLFDEFAAPAGPLRLFDELATAVPLRLFDDFAGLDPVDI